MRAEIGLSERPPGTVTDAKSIASELIRRTRADDRFDAASILASHPELSADRSVVLELAYEEFCRRVDGGEQLSPHDFARSFPHVEQSLLRVLEVHEFFQQDDAFPGLGPSPDALEVGDEFLGFSLVLELGHGAFSRVFLAHERELGDRQVVVKICGRDGEEAARLGRLSHPHIVPIHSVQCDPDTGLTAICMPWLGNATLLDLLDAEFGSTDRSPRRGRILSVARHGVDPHLIGNQNEKPDRGISSGSYAEGIVALGAQLCDALACAHAQEIYHCDIKPSNVLLAASGKAVLLDFNLSQQGGALDWATGGTLPYMAPEQLQQLLDSPDEAAPPISPQTDLFALGVLMHQMLTGEHPLGVTDSNGSRQETVRELLRRLELQSFSTFRLEQIVGPRLAQSIIRCLAYDPSGRPESAEELAGEFRRFLSFRSRSRRWIGRHRLVAGVASLILTASIVTAAAAALTGPPRVVREYEAGIALLDADDFAPAVQRLSSALEADPESAEALLARGWARLLLAENGDLDETEKDAYLAAAHADFDASFRVGSSGEAAASLGYCECLIGNDYSSAAESCLEAIDRDFRIAEVWNNLGCCQLKLGNTSKAIESFKQAVEIQPGLRWGHRNLALAQFRISYLNRETAVPIQRAIEHIELSRRTGEPTPDLEVEAACIYAAALGQIPEGAKGLPNQRLAIRDEIFSACASAVKRGATREQLQIVRQYWLNPSSHDLETLERLLRTAPQSSAVTIMTALTSPHYSSPFREIRSSIVNSP